MAILTNALLQEAVSVAKRNREMAARMTAAFMERYGVTYSDVDCDTLIDALDYGLGSAPTLADADNAMATVGVYPR